MNAAFSTGTHNCEGHTECVLFDVHGGVIKRWVRGFVLLEQLHNIVGAYELLLQSDASGMVSSVHQEP